MELRTFINLLNGTMVDNGFSQTGVAQNDSKFARRLDNRRIFARDILGVSAICKITLYRDAKQTEEEHLNRGNGYMYICGHYTVRSQSSCK